MGDAFVVRKGNERACTSESRLAQRAQLRGARSEDTDSQLRDGRHRDLSDALGRRTERATLLGGYEHAGVGDVAGQAGVMSSVVRPVSKSAGSESTPSSSARAAIAARSATRTSDGRRSLRERRGTMSATGLPCTVKTTGSPLSTAAITRPVWFRSSLTE